MKTPNANKPKTQEEWEIWARNWDLMSNEERIQFCQDIKVTEGTARVWRSLCGVPKTRKIVSTSRPQDTIDILLSGRPAVNLDFVSFDIETSNLKADFSVMLSAVIKPFGQPPIVFRADQYSTWETNRSNDKAIVEDVCRELGKHAIVVSHFGIGFDIPYIRAKCVAYGIPPLPPMFGIDTWKIAKNNFNVSRRSLANLGYYFDIGDKSLVDGRTWVQAAYDGDREAMEYIIEHNIQDCVLLEKLACLSFPYTKSVPRL